MANNVALSILMNTETGRVSMYEEFIKMTFRVNENKYTVMPVYKKTSSSSNLFGSSQEEFTKKLVQGSKEAEIVSNLGIEGIIDWETVYSLYNK